LAVIALLATCALARAATTLTPADEQFSRTPKPPEKPRINGPRVYGVWPGKPVLFRIPATGRQPMQFAVEGLPEGLALDLLV
jgi:alpha-galactosidase